MMNQPEHAPGSKAPPSSAREKISLAIQLILSFAVAVGVFLFLLWSGDKAASEHEQRPQRPEAVVTEILKPNQPPALQIRKGTPLDDKLTIDVVRAQNLTAPLLPVTGTVLASLRTGAATPQDRWQFATSDLLQAFADWQKSVTDVAFQEKTLELVRNLNEKRIDAQEKVVARLVKLVAAGTDTEKDLAVERTNLIQFQIQGRKEIHEAETAYKLSQRAEATLARQLQQAGLDPAVLRAPKTEGEIVVAEVPERSMSRVKLGMTCKVTFFALPDLEFTGQVSSIAPTVNKDKRVVNVQFIVKDPQNQLRPGMFAQIGLGTDQRKALLLPADGVLHVGDRDFALKEIDGGNWQIVPVVTGELFGTDLELLSGLQAGDRVLGKGAILLKPAVVRALHAQ
jgi:membrane fusion protein, heavy metal efflux system